MIIGMPLRHAVCAMKYGFMIFVGTAYLSQEHITLFVYVLNNECLGCFLVGCTILIGLVMAIPIAMIVIGK